MKVMKAGRPLRGKDIRGVKKNKLTDDCVNVDCKFFKEIVYELKSEAERMEVT